MKKGILNILTSAVTASALIAVVLTAYLAGYKTGGDAAKASIPEIEETATTATIEKGETKIIYVTPKPAPAPAKPASWSGPALWEAVNKRRVEKGVNPLSQRDELCTIASIRLNQLLELGKLDGHEGFGRLPETRSDLKWIFEKYNISEFLVSGVSSPSEAVSLWENSLGHKQLLTGGEYVWGCTYAQNGFGVAIAAY